jgi:uncharacterized protein (DUF983 family)
MFDGLLKFHTRCDACGLPFDRFNVGDGPAAFVVLIVGAIVVVAAVLADAAFMPPWWVHALIWTPLIVALTILSLRAIKGVLLSLEFNQQAREGQIDGPS